MRYTPSQAIHFDARPLRFRGLELGPSNFYREESTLCSMISRAENGA
jgi:hypothetical protein